MNAVFFSFGVSLSAPIGSGGSGCFDHNSTIAVVTPTTAVPANTQRARGERRNQRADGPKAAPAKFTTSSRLRFLQVQEEPAAVAIFDVVRRGLHLIGPRVGLALAVFQRDEFFLARKPFPILRALGH